MDTGGKYTVVNNAVAVENPKEDPSSWKPRLTLDYAKRNDGSSAANTATLVNKFDLGFPRTRVRFVVPKGADYAVSAGTIEQAFEGDDVKVIDVRVPLPPNSTTRVGIVKHD